MLLNTGLLKHPMNWVTVLLMSIIGFMALNLIMTPFLQDAPDNSELSPNSIPTPILMPFQ
jgi:hypothetical protein